jgi:hypothetical protein
MELSLRKLFRGFRQPERALFQHSRSSGRKPLAGIRGRLEVERLEDRLVPSGAGSNSNNTGGALTHEYFNIPDYYASLSQTIKSYLLF